MATLSVEHIADGGEAGAEDERGGDGGVARDLADGLGGFGHVKSLKTAICDCLERERWQSHGSPGRTCAMRIEIFRAERMRQQRAQSSPSGSPSMPMQITGVSSAANSRMRWRQPPQGVTGAVPGPVTYDAGRCALPPPAIMAAMAEASAQLPADRRRSRHCSRHRSCRRRQGSPRRPGSANRAHRRRARTASAASNSWRSIAGEMLHLSAP